MPTLCFGGSFNPIHHGHLRVAAAVADNAAYDRVLLIPSAQPPHKPASADLAAAADRLAMCQLAVEGSGLFDVCDLEVRRAGPSYTIDTARELHSRGLKTIHWLIGADMLRILPSWHQAQDLLHEVHFVIVARPGWTFDWQSLPVDYRHLQANVVEAPLIDIRATEIRRRIRAGESIQGMTPPAVIDYIQQHHLYR